MERNMDDVRAAHQPPAAILRAAFSDLVTAGLEAFTRWLEDGNAAPSYDDPRIRETDGVGDAAALLGVAVDATADEVRAAFRARVKERVSTGEFHDQRGDATDRDAQALIAAKNLMIEHTRKGDDHASL